jgi:hypothetical protein
VLPIFLLYPLRQNSATSSSDSPIQKKESLGTFSVDKISFSGIIVANKCLQDKSGEVKSMVASNHPLFSGKNWGDGKEEILGGGRIQPPSTLIT